MEVGELERDEGEWRRAVSKHRQTPEQVARRLSGTRTSPGTFPSQEMS